MAISGGFCLRGVCPRWVSAKGGCLPRGCLPKRVSAQGRCISEFNGQTRPPLMDRILYTLLLRTVKSTMPNLRHLDLAVPCKLTCNTVIEQNSRLVNQHGHTQPHTYTHKLTHTYGHTQTHKHSHTYTLWNMSNHLLNDVRSTLWTQVTAGLLQLQGSLGVSADF